MMSLNNKVFKPDTGWNIFCDFDGTITYFDVTDSLLERFAKPEWKAIEQEWKLGLFGSLECMDRQVRLLDMSLVELDDHLDKIEIDPDFAAFVKAAQDKGHQVTVISDGLDYSIQRVLRRCGLGDLPVFANQLHQCAERSWRLTFPNAHKDCLYGSGHCKCTTMKKGLFSKDGLRPALLIGDGRSDFCAAGAVELVFAKKPLSDYCQKGNLPHFAINNFATALDLLSELKIENSESERLSSNI